MDVAREAPARASSTPLSAPASTSQVHTLSIVILIVAVLSALGAAWMILGFVVSTICTFLFPAIKSVFLSACVYIIRA